MPSESILTFISVSLAAAVLLSGSAAAAEVSIVPPEDITDRTIPGQQMNPASIVYGDELYLFWASNSAETPIGQDFDITYATWDGDGWSKNVVLTSNDTGNDHTPRPIVFGSSLYLFWSSTNPVITGGSDADIVYATFDGEIWSGAAPITSDFNSTGDYDPCPVVLGNELHLFFEWFSPGSMHYEIGHAVYDGTWRDVEAVTENSTGHNLNPTVAVLGQSIVLAWETTSSALVGSAVKSVVSRVLAGGEWSGLTSVSGDAGPMNLDPYLVAFGESLWLFWSTNSEALSSGADFDVVTRTYGAAGWAGTVTEVFAVQDTGNDTSPSAAVHDGMLVLAWVSDSYEFDGESDADTDVIMAVCDAGEWSAPEPISYNDGSRPDGGGMTHRPVSMADYDGKVVMIWETNASPLLTETRNTWLVLAECDFQSSGMGIYMIAVPLALMVALVAFILLRKR